MDLKELRENRELRLVDVASNLDVAESTVRNWEKGRTHPKLRAEQFKRLIDLYQVTFENLLVAIKLSESKDSQE